MPQDSTSTSKVLDAQEPVQEAPKQLPELTLKNVCLDIVHGIHLLLNDPFLLVFWSFLIFIIELIAGKLIIFRVPYTEIDFSTYLQQVQLFNKGELDYEKIVGETGPLVYPAGHLWIFKVLNNIYEEDHNLEFIQLTYAWLLNLTLINYLISYNCFNNSLRKPWFIVFLILSKRIQSIYLLRLFNDCWAAYFISFLFVGLQLTSLIKQKFNSSTHLISLLMFVNSITYSLAISIKMNSLLYLPAFLLISFYLNNGNFFKTVLNLLTIIGSQYLIAYPFFNNGDQIKSNYLHNAFNFKRHFLHNWSINWRFLPEFLFQDSRFHFFLLFSHLLVLSFFLFSVFLPLLNNKLSITKNLNLKQNLSHNINQFLNLLLTTLKKPFNDNIQLNNNILNYQDGPQTIFAILSITNLIGVAFSRSLHYQFLTWYFFHLPFLINLSNTNVFLIIIGWLLHENCWLNHPVAWKSVVFNVLIFGLLLRIWFQLNKHSNSNSNSNSNSTQSGEQNKTDEKNKKIK
ncbi:dolichyl-P-Man:Man(5)GlcNAc(2)-PP-dolichol alpha-1,3-mannosyltransferase [Ascoidea rubescens DSM 1968]|uniref:Dol-P-Man:Man(5)GlcNAc(2)-PP-Dol alpha-1,3-mannosyltransferase n=1 Tax=Ascoidea rubescens DSM 1968 TaxID=1344418 RepID=A0A1D2VRY7_9ASCO|nr:glycosyltransferase family 58 protein [Ascoidea rubescens DSM 1968]ODV64360.1 glycosyltransferase family 58 protein [Ascoidea rubescens DSM 1968]